MIDNIPDIWLSSLPYPDAASHKYSRGQAVIVAAPDMIGATVLSAVSCARMGAGVVRVLADNQDSQRHLQTVMPPHMIVTTDDNVLCDSRTHAVLLGSGCTGNEARLGALLTSHITVSRVLDGGALRFIADNGRYDLLSDAVITPHEGEYEALFGQDKRMMQRDMSHKYRCTIVLKGAETVITTANGECIVNRHSSPWLATAGTGDVLAGMITGLLAQGMESLCACAAAVWIHGEAGRRIGAGMVSSDIPHILPIIYEDILGQ